MPKITGSPSAGLDPVSGQEAAIVAGALQATATSRIVKLLRRINHAGDLHSKRLFRSIGLSLPQLIVLATIRELGEVTAGRIASSSSLSQGTVSVILDRLEAHGMIDRYRSTRDRRVVHARLTAAGAAAVDAAPPLLHDSFVTRFASLVPEEQSRILSALETVADLMDQGGEVLPDDPALMDHPA